MRIVNYFVILGVALTLFSCKGNGNKQNVEADALEAADSAEVPVVIERLPDTVFPSAEKIKYKVDIFDSAVNGRLESLTDLYDNKQSLMTFRRGLKRQGNFDGRLDSMPKAIKIDWTFKTAEDWSPMPFGPWGGGSGWTGQPLYVEWPDSLAAKLKNSGAVLPEFNGKEIIVGSLCGKIYFIEPRKGVPTRNPIDAGNPIKGTPSFDPTFNGNLYVGQGVPGKRPFGAIGVSLFTNKVFDMFAEDSKAWRHWGAYDSSPLRVGQFLFRPAENGGIYKFIVGEASLKLHSVLRYSVGGAAPGIESSMAIYSNYGFVTDNHGNILGVNLDNLTPVWHYSIGDDTDATPLVAVENGIPYLYVGCEIDRQARGYCVFVKLNGLTGEEEWKAEVPGKRYQTGTKHFDGGFYASALLGKGNCEGLIFTNCVKNLSGQNGAFVAFDRKTGAVKYETPLKAYAWSSPVGYLLNDGRWIVVTGDCHGNIYVINGENGEIILTEKVGHNFESSPAIVDNSIILGSRTNGIYKITLQ
ncbi:MAG: dehydrogenase [Paramuribaculum sp.]|nr:dehydrogenase [Paramuribaculum sp.]